MPFMPFMPCHRQTPLSAYKFALNCHAMPVGRFWEVQKVQIQTQFLFWNHALGKERFSKAVQRLLFMILSIVFLALFERPLWTFPKSRHRLMGLCVSGSDLKRVTRLRHPGAPSGTRHLGVPPGLVLCGRSRLLLCSSGARPRWQSNLIT